MTGKNKQEASTKFSVNQLLAGLEYGPMDEVLLEYLAGFCQSFEVRHAAFVHVLKNHVLAGAETLDIDPGKLEQSESEAVGSYLRKLVQTHLGKCMDGRFTLFVEPGDPLEVLLRNAQELNSDLVAIGQKTSVRSHGITAKNFIRHVSCNALLVPQGARWKLERILVPVDFSEGSGQALQLALSIRNSLEPAPVVDVLHLYDLPITTGTFRISETRLLEAIDEERKESMRRFIQQHVPEAVRKQVRTIVKACRHRSIGTRIVDFATRRRDNLIVMGARGHSPLERLLMGSVTEKVLSVTTKIPVLVVRTNGT